MEENNKANICVYANQVGITGGIYDIALKFFNMHNKEEEICVVMSPQHAKSLSTMLNETINAYEKEIGEIVLPSEKYSL